ncbi:MAG TPA: hypothetical protein PLO62_05800 [Candidatus Hydrogenedentes bacterium]|nr:hypothetical protein [Candidatus Hydrogenedentota bacterium]
MSKKRFWASVALFLVLFFTCFMYAGPVVAAPKAPEADGGGDKSYMDKKGIEGLFSGGGKKDPRAPKTWQKALGIGSIVVMVIALKYL